MASASAQRVGRRKARLRLRAEGDELRHLASTGAGRLLAGVVAVFAAATVIGLLALWPFGWEPPAKALNHTVPAKVTRVADAACAAGAAVRLPDQLGGKQPPPAAGAGAQPSPAAETA